MAEKVQRLYRLQDDLFQPQREDPAAACPGSAAVEYSAALEL